MSVAAEAAPAPATASAPPPPSSTPRQHALLGLYAVTSLLTASLIFVVQPMVARMVLPAFGGSPQVWTTAMLFFQTSLLAGYLYSHLVTSRLRADRQPLAHLLLFAVPLLMLPIALGIAPSGRGGVAPVLELLIGLTLGVAAPFILVATSGPLLQRWFSWTDHPRAADPYLLYAAGNLGSIGGLLAYPFLLEPVLTVADQAHFWAYGYGVALAMLVACAVPALRAQRNRVTAAGGDHEVVREASRPVGRRRGARWLLMAFIPSSTMLAATTYLSTDVAAVPMLWVLPLATYLATFVVAFSGWGPQAARFAHVVAVPVGVLALVVRPTLAGVWFSIGVQLALVAVAGLLCHGRLSADRPPPAQLTRFYVFLAIGGALGGLFNGIVAPVVFPVTLEHGLIVALLVWVVVGRNGEPFPGARDLRPPMRLAGMLVLGLLPAGAFLLTSGLVPVPGRVAVLTSLLIVVIALAFPVGRATVVAVSVSLLMAAPAVVQLAEARDVERTFFGVHRVIDNGSIRGLMHGTTLHGNQDLTDGTTRRLPSTYYADDGPFGDLAAYAAGRGDVGVLGLGAGGLAAYGQAGQRMDFYEIDPAMERIAREHFTYLEDSEAEISVTLGDGRLMLDGVEDRYALMVADAFSSDSVPVHLLTVEATATYLDTLSDDGAVVFHLSNRYLELLPVVVGAADELGLDVVTRRTPPEAERALPTLWAVVAPDDGRLDELRDAGWEEPTAPPRPWTDQRSDLWSVVRR